MTEQGLYELLGGVNARSLTASATRSSRIRSSGEPAAEGKDLRITSEVFDEVGAEIASALDYFNVREHEKQEVLGRHRRP